MGTIAGNLTLRHRNKEFVSDIYTAFEALNVDVVLKASPETTSTLTLAEYMQTDINFKVVTEFILKPYDKQQHYFAAYKVIYCYEGCYISFWSAIFLVLPGAI